jgi:hypothetical protein
VPLNPLPSSRKRLRGAVALFGTDKDCPFGSRVGDGLDPPPRALGHRYIASLYWSLSTMSTIAYGDITPRSSSERIFAMFVMVRRPSGRTGHSRAELHCKLQSSHRAIPRANATRPQHARGCAHDRGRPFFGCQK